jgi:hypothetical protein
MKVFTKRYLSILLTIAICASVFAGCGKKESSETKKKKTKATEEIEEVEDTEEPEESETEPEGDFSFEKEIEESFSSDEPVVATADFTFDSTLSLLDGEHTLKIRKAKSFPKIDTEQKDGVVYDFEIEDVSEFEGVLEISIPISKGSDETVVAAYYNEEQGAWMPVCAQYDGEKMVILTDHLSTYGAFRLTKPNTRNANGTYSVLLDTYIDTVTTEEAEDLILEPFKNNSATSTDILYAFADGWGKASQFGNDIGYNALKTAGYTIEFLEDYGDLLSEIGMYFAAYQAIRQCMNGNAREGVGTAIKATHNFVVGLAAGALKSAIMTASMAAVAIFDFALTKLYERVISSRKDVYRGGYLKYYSKEEKANGGGYRSEKEWFKILYPIFKDGDNSPYKIKLLVGREVNKYVKQFWTEESVMEMYFADAANMGWTLGGGLNDDIMEELNNEHRSTLYNDILPKVFEAIRDKLELNAWSAYSQKMYELGEKLNAKTTLSFKDSTIGSGNSEYAGCIVKFKNVPSEIEDPENWQCTLSKSGTGSISFTGFAYLYNKFAPELVIVDPDDPDKILKELTFGISGNKVEIDIGGKKEPEVTPVPSEYAYDPVSEWGAYHNGEPEPEPTKRDEYYIQYVFDNLPNGTVTRNGDYYHIDLTASGYPIEYYTLDEIKISGDFADRDPESKMTASYKITQTWTNESQGSVYTKTITFSATKCSASYSPEYGIFTLFFQGDYAWTLMRRSVKGGDDVLFDEGSFNNSMMFNIYMQI